MLNLDLINSGMDLRESWNQVRDLGILPEWTQRLKVGSSPNEVIFSRGNLRLLRYVMPRPRLHATPIVIIPSLINRHYILDLLPGKSLIEFLSNEGFQVYLIEWLAPKLEDRHVSFERLFNQRLARALDLVARQSPQGQFHLVGQCLGGTLAILEATQRQERMKSLTLLTTPVDFSGGGKLTTWAAESGLDIEAVVDAYGNLPWPIMQAAFHCLRPSVGFGKWSHALSKVKDVDFLLTFLGIEMWANDNISLVGKVYQTVIRDFYQDNALIKQRFKIDGKTADLNSIVTPILDVSAVDDHIVPPAMCWPKSFNDGRTTRMLLPGGHIGALFGKRAQKTFWPEWSQWLQNAC
jgi:polyhydroxyalkanoate synthase